MTLTARLAAYRTRLETSDPERAGADAELLDVLAELVAWHDTLEGTARHLAERD